MSSINALDVARVAAPDPVVRAAHVSDYDECVRLFRELGEPRLFAQEVWRREMLPTSLVVESGGRLIGHAFAQPLDDTICVSHIVVDPQARRRGIARLLLQAVARSGVDKGFRHWVLNVDPANAPAVRLYESLGFRYAHDSMLLQLSWSAVLSQPRSSPLVARRIESSDEARVGTALAILPGIFAVARTRPDAVLMLVEDDAARVVGAAVFGPRGFPNSHPFRVAKDADPASAFALLAALAPFALGPTLALIVEGHTELREVLVQAGAVEQTRIAHYRARLPST